MRKNYLGIDIGGTNTRIVLLRGLRPQRVRALKFPTPRNCKAVETELLEKILHFTNGAKLSGIGVGIAGVVSQKKKKVEVEEKPWTVKDDNGVESYSLLAPPVAVTLIKQLSKVLNLL